jgi:tetratricopeptide (TPR) repeat protein
MDPRIFYCLGIMYQEEGLYPFALTEYQRFLRHYPEDKEIRMLAAKLYYRMGMFPEAVGEYERLKFNNPSDPLVEENFGLSLWGAKQSDRAIASFTTLKTYGGDFERRAEFYLGQLALEAGKFDEAADHFGRTAVGTAPLPGIPDERVYTDLGMALQKLSRWDEAKTAWEAVLKADPKDPKAQAALREVTRRAAAAKKAADKADKPAAKKK